MDCGAYEDQNFSDCPEDLDGDGTVDVDDLTLLVLAWGFNPGHAGDLDCSDNTVDVDDLTLLVLAYGDCGLAEGGAPNGPEGGDGPDEAAGDGPVSDLALFVALVQMGFAGVADYVEWLQGASDADAYDSCLALIELLDPN